MTDALFIVAEDGTLTAAPRTPYALEDDLQKLIAEHPELLPGDQINPTDPRRWRLVKREAGVGSATAPSRWSLDHLFVDQDAIPTLVEAKRGGNPEARREVVAQLLEYAANGTLYWPLDQLRSWFETQTGGHEAAIAAVGALTGGDPSEEAYGAFWVRFESNLRERRIRLIFVADDIPPELRTLVEFLNEQMERVEVLAVEVVQYAHDGRQLLKPQLVGQTTSARAKKESGANGAKRANPWTEPELIDRLSATSPFAAQCGKKVVEWAANRGNLVPHGNRGLTWPMVAYKVTLPNRETFTFCSLYGVANSIVEIPFGRISQSPPFTDTEQRSRLHNDLRPLTRMAKDDPDIEAYAYAGIHELNTEQDLESLLRILGAALDAIEQSASAP
jgi:hypothetical protein